MSKYAHRDGGGSVLDHCNLVDHAHSFGHQVDVREATRPPIIGASQHSGEMEVGFALVSMHVQVEVDVAHGSPDLWAPADTTLGDGREWSPDGAGSRWHGQATKAGHEPARAGLGASQLGLGLVRASI
jgi:hypothetical protein